MAYHPRSRARRILKWTGLVVLVLAAAAWTVRLWFGHGWLGDYFGYGLCRGWIGLTWYYRGGAVGGPRGWWYSTYGGAFTQWIEWWPDMVKPQNGCTLAVPLWMPFLAFAIPTGWLWHRDRRPPLGFCQACAYDLTGNTSGVCPECGEPT